MSRTGRAAVWRVAPLALIAVLTGPFLTVLNPGLFWDDWVWIFQDPQENIQVGRELGIWWGGYLTNAINALPQPVLTLRCVALVAWVIAAAAAAWSLRRLRFVNDWEAWILFLLTAAAPIPMVRFLTSVAMYNVYIASFWVGCAILVSDIRSVYRRWSSLPFFVFSFYLNSLLVLYGGVLLLLLWDTVRQLIKNGNKLDLWPPSLRGARFSALPPSISLPAVLVSFMRRYWFVVALPLVFFVVTTLLKAPSPFYAGYNQVRPLQTLAAVLQASSALPILLVRYVSVPVSTVPPLYAGLTTFALIYPVRLLPNRHTILPWRGIVLRTGIGAVIFYLALLSFYVVGKPPILDDYYESRHILTAVPAIVLLEIALLEALARVCARFSFFAARLVRDVGVAFLLACSILFSITSGLALLVDWASNEAIGSFLTAHADAVKTYGTFIFDDQSTGMRIDRRYIWNYEYTGELIKTFGSQGRLGVSLPEYLSWPKDVPLLADSVYRTRYNLQNYDFHKPHLVVTIQDGRLRASAGYVIRGALSHWFGHAQDFSGILAFSLSQEYVEADRQMALMEQIVAALDAYKREHGSYPGRAQTNGWQGAAPDSVPKTILGDPGDFGSPTSAPQPGSTDGWLDKLVPNDLAADAVDPACRPTSCGLLYLSDGLDFKLVYQHPRDMPYARQAYGLNLDPIRTAYGFWTPKAATW